MYLIVFYCHIRERFIHIIVEDLKSIKSKESLLSYNIAYKKVCEEVILYRISNNLGYHSCTKEQIFFCKKIKFK